MGIRHTGKHDIQLAGFPAVRNDVCRLKRKALGTVDSKGEGRDDGEL